MLLLAGLAACGGSSTEVDAGGAGGLANGGRTGTGGGLGRGTGGTGVAGSPGSGAAGGTTVIGGAGSPGTGTGGGTAGSGVAGSGVTETGGTSAGGAAGAQVVGTGGNTGGGGAVTPTGGRGGATGGIVGMAGRGGAAGGGLAGRGGNGVGGRGGAGVGGAGGAAACANGTHRCGTACVANNSIESGCTANGCTACRDTTNGDPVCRGNTCDITCQSNFHGCGTAATRTCVADNSTSNNSCGNTCMACPTMTGGTSTCDGAKCVPRCNAGFHLCNGACVANSNPMMCGPDDGDCRPCPTGESCTSAGACQTTSCGPPNQHVCGNMCVDQSAAQCGPNCTTCPPPSADKNLVATCTAAGVCRNVCKSSSYHQCGTADDPICKLNNDPMACGSSCTPCSPATLDQGVVGCNGTSCTYTCNEGYHECKADTAGTPICLLNNSVESCGNKCVRCDNSTKAGSNQTPICELGSGNTYQCGITCVDQTKKCGIGSAAVCCPTGQMCTNGACVATGAGGASGG